MASGSSTKPRSKSVYDFLGLVFVSLFYYVFVLSPGPVCNVCNLSTSP